MRPIPSLLLLGLAVVMIGCRPKGPSGPVPLTLANHGDKRMVFEVVAGVSGQDMAKARRAVRVVLDPGRQATYKLPVGGYTLFPREWMFQGTFGLAFYPFTLKPGEPMVISLDSTNRPTFTGSASWTTIRSRVTKAPASTTTAQPAARKR